MYRAVRRGLERQACRHEVTKALARIRHSYVQMQIDLHAVSTEAFRTDLQEAARWFEEVGAEAGLATTWNESRVTEMNPFVGDF